MIKNNNIFLLLILTILSILSKINCELQLPYFYSFKSTGVFETVNIETNQVVLNKKFSLDFQINLIYGETISSETNQPIFKLFVQDPSGRIFYTIQYDSGLNQFNNKSAELKLSDKASFEYDPTSFNYIQGSELFILTVHMDGTPQSVLSFIEWDFTNSKINYYQNTEKVLYKTLPVTTINPLTKEVFTYFTGQQNVPYIQVNENNTLSGNDIKVYKFLSNSTILTNIDNIFVNLEGDLIGVGYQQEGEGLFVCLFNLDSLECTSVYNTQVISFDNNFSVYYISPDSSYLIILIGDGFNCDTIEFNYLNLLTFKVDYSFKTNNFYKPPQNYPSIYF
ncbi:hypothetical protein RB653_005358 [Dictyostelium firmibasis]|uniref:Transmembrane protein n=1 Tax=Dictyostelium firmibasis TaxID=79012 RepID=A0AAN7YSW5_9MYCE